MPGRGWHPCTVASVAALLLLRLLQKTMEYQFIVLAGNRTNSSTEGDLEPGSLLASVTSWTYTCRYLLPVLGGLLSCLLGHVRVLQLGGFVMLVTSGVMSAAVYLDSWRGDSPIALTACLLMPVFNGLVMPTAMQGVLSKRTEPRYRTVLCALIYASSAGGLFAGVQISKLNQIMGAHIAIVLMLIAAIFCTVALPLSLPCARLAAEQDKFDEAEEDAGLSRLVNPVQWLTHNRLQRCFLFFCAFTPFLAGLCDDRATVFKAEINSLLTDTNLIPTALTPTGDGGSGAQDMLTSAILSVGLLLVNLCMLTASCCIRSPSRRLPINGRVVAGFILQGMNEIGLAVVSAGAVRFANLAALNAFYTAASLADATSAMLVMVAAYEIMDGFQRDASRPLIVGVMLTVWGLAAVASRLLLMACRSLLPQGQLFGYHVILLALLIGGLLYTWCFALRIAETLSVTYRWRTAAAQVGELDPLLPPADQSSEPALDGNVQA